MVLSIVALTGWAFERGLNLSVIIVGSAVGWLIAVLLSPDPSGTTAERLQKGAGVASAIITGYVIAKMEKSITRLLSPKVLFIPLVGFRVLSFLGSFCATLIFVFVWREYRRAASAPSVIEQKQTEMIADKEQKQETKLEQQTGREDLQKPESGN